MINRRVITAATRVLIRHCQLRLFMPSIAGTSRCSSAQVIFDNYRVIKCAVPCYQSCLSLWTSSGRFYSENGQTKQCWQCNSLISTSPSTEFSSQEQVAVCEKCGSLQRISGDVNYFGLFNLDPNYDIDVTHLRQQYLRLQQNMHPDRNVNRSDTESEFSADNSSLINTAYKTLRDPYQRALYLLKQRYMIIIEEDNVETEPELLLEIMELNEDIELATDKDSLQAVSKHLEEEIIKLVNGLKTAFAEDNASAARQLVLRFAYYTSSLDKLKSQLMRVL